MLFREDGEWKETFTPVEFHTREFSDKFLSEVLSDYASRAIIAHGESAGSIIGIYVRRLVVENADTHWGLSIDHAADVVVPKIWRLFKGDNLKFTSWVSAHLTPLGADQERITHIVSQQESTQKTTMKQEGLF